MENPIDIENAKPGWMCRVGLLEVGWGKERLKILSCVKAEFPILLLSSPTYKDPCLDVGIL